MEKEEKSAIDEFLGGLEKSEQPLFEDKKEEPIEESAEEAPVEEKEEKPLPFHKDPKVQKFIEKEISKRLENVKAEPAKAVTVQAEEDDFYTRLIGNDTPEKVAMIREYKAREERLIEQAEERAFNRLSAKEQEALKADQEAEQELESAFDSIEDTYEVDLSSGSPNAKKTRQEFVTFIEKIAPKDKNGDILDYPDIPSAWETFQEIQKSKQTPSRAKDLASRSMARSAETASTQPKRIDWNAVDDMMDNLK